VTVTLAKKLMTTSVGSFPRPSWLAETNRGRAKFLHDGDALREAQDDATRLSLYEQERLGLDILTDGEQRRESFVYHAASNWEGVDFAELATKDTYRGRTNFPKRVPRIVGPVRRRSSPSLDEARFAKAHTSLPVKIAVVGPQTMVDSTVDRHYRDDAARAMDFAAAINEELLDLQAAGCDMIQIDEPAMNHYHDEVYAYGARALDRCLDGVTVPTIVHLCFGYPGDLPPQHDHTYPRLLDRLLETRIGGFTEEFGRSDYDPAILAPCRGRLVMFGCVDPGDTPPPTIDTVKRRVAGALEHLDPAQLMLAPDCGLMTIGRPLAREKIRVMVAAAHALREEI
jgi:5-methyltetrahydropteroyltriglutamate--homocysteine methyltransferase